MIQRGFTILGVACALAMAALVSAVPAQVPEQTHYTYVSYWAVPRAQWANFEKSQEQSYSVLERLVADGTVIAWGSGAALVHTEDGYTHAEWFVSNNQAGITKTLESLRAVSATQALSDSTKHMDRMLHTIVHGGKTARTTSGYLRLAFYEAKPGRGDDVEHFFKKYVQPDEEAGVTDGSVLMYNFDTEQIHTDAPGGYILAVLYAKDDDLDKGNAIWAAHTKENRDEFGAMLETQAHRDGLFRIIAFQHK
jgi:hypothetical protein